MTEWELEHLKRDAARYRYIRTLTPRAFWELWEISLLGRQTFDEIVDARVALRNGRKRGGTESTAPADQVL